MDIFGKENFSSSNPSLVALSAAAAALRIETESTLSNITSLQSQSQSLYDSDINNQHLLISNQYNSRQTIDDDDDQHVVVVHNNNTTNSHRTLQKKSSSSQQQHQQQHHQTAITGSGSSTMENFDGILAPPNSLVGDFGTNAVAATTSCNTTNVANSNKTATILVSKHKTKTGLPLLLKNSIKN